MSSYCVHSSMTSGMACALNLNYAGKNCISRERTSSVDNLPSGRYLLNTDICFILSYVYKHSATVLESNINNGKSNAIIHNSPPCFATLLFPILKSIVQAIATCLTYFRKVDKSYVISAWNRTKIAETRSAYDVTIVIVVADRNLHRTPPAPTSYPRRSYSNNLNTWCTCSHVLLVAVFEIRQLIFIQSLDLSVQRHKICSVTMRCGWLWNQ